MDVNSLIGMDEYEAKGRLLEAGKTALTTKRDSENLAFILIACHYHLHVEKGKVVVVVDVECKK